MQYNQFIADLYIYLYTKTIRDTQHQKLCVIRCNVICIEMDKILTTFCHITQERDAKSYSKVKRMFIFQQQNSVYC